MEANSPKEMNFLPVTVSVVTPTYNRAHLLSRTWNSIKEQPVSFEWVVVDDASTDNTREVINSFSDNRIVYIRHPQNKGGPNAGRNNGARIASGRFVVFLDDDDEMYPGSLEKMVQHIDMAPPQVGVVAFQCVIGGTGIWDDKIVDGAIYKEEDIVCHNVLGLEKILIYRKEVFKYFELPEDILCSDGVFVLNVSRKYDFMMIAKPGRIYHHDTTSVSSPSYMITASRHAALGYERIMENHKVILDRCNKAMARYTIKALYRYAVAGCQSDVSRMFSRLLTSGRFIDIGKGFIIFLLGLTGTVQAIDKYRLLRILKKTFPASNAT